MAPPLPGPAIAPPTWNCAEAPLPPPSPRDLAIVVHPLPSGVELQRLALPFSADDIFSSYEGDVIVRNDSFTLWIRIKIEELLALHMVDAYRATAEYREVSERKPVNSSPMHQTDRRCKRSFNQTKTSQCLQLEPRTSARKRRRRQVAHHYPSRGD